MGAFTEAIWLLGNKFNFIKLALGEMPWHLGGPRVYLISVYPAFLAIAMRIIKDHRLFLLFNHLLGIGLSSASIVLFFKMLSQDFSRKVSLVASLLLLFHPLYLSQSYALNMEVPILFFALLAVFCFLKQRFILAGVFSLFAFFIKSASLTVTITLVVLYMLVYFRIKEGKHIKIVLFYSLPLWIYALYLFLASRYFFGQGLPQKITVFAGLQQIMLYAVRWPDLFCLILLVPVSAAALSKRYVNLLRTKSNRTIQDKAMELRTLAQQNSLIVTNTVFCAVLLLLLANYVSVNPRYLFLGLPFFIMLSAHLVLQKLNKFLLIFVCGLVFVFYLLNFGGNVYSVYWNVWADVFKMRQLETIADYKYRNDGHVLEATLAYEDDMELNREAARFIEESYSDKKIIANWPLSHILSNPLYGYVKNELYVIDVTESSLSADENLKEITLDDTGQYVWVYTKNIFSIGSPEVYDPARDVLLKRIKRGTHQIVIFRRPL